MLILPNTKTPIISLSTYLLQIFASQLNFLPNKQLTVLSLQFQPKHPLRY
uniref:Uncharacterized protein n=1 Tax=Arundo donax TaxID=35708 RepID=A0A0A9HFY0_ARUDO